jgi:hypothetical protein
LAIPCEFILLCTLLFLGRLAFELTQLRSSDLSRDMALDAILNHLRLPKTSTDHHPRIRGVELVFCCSA